MGIYSSLEDKWYDFLDKVNNVIPVYKIVDPIDSVFPSFLLFLITIILVIALILFSVSNSFGTIYEVEVIVLTNNNLPIKDAVLTINLDDSEKKFNSDASGKISFETREEFLLASISKANFKTINQQIDAKEKNIVKLQASTQDPNGGNDLTDNTKTIIISVTDISSVPLPNAEIDFLCDGTTKKSLDNQPSTGFSLVIDEVCSVMQVKASNFGYEDKTITLNRNDERATIKLTKINNSGRIGFKVTDPNLNSVRDNAEITIKDEFGSVKKILLTNIQGEAETELEFGNYSFVASVFGKKTSQEFEVNSTVYKNINVIIQGIEVSDDGNIIVDGINPNDPVSSSNLRDIAFELVDNNSNPIFGSIIKIYSDGNYYTEKRTATNGKTEGIRTTIKDNAKYVAFINNPDYETKIVSVELQQKSAHQKIVLDNPRIFLKLTIVNDLNVVEKKSVVRIYSDLLSDPVITKTVDVNGVVEVTNLAPGKYTIFAIDATGKTEFTEEIVLRVGDNIDKLLTLVTGTGKMRFNFVTTTNNVELKVLPDNNFFVKTINSEDYIRSSALVKKTSYFETDSLIVGAKNKVIVNDNNFFSKESFEYVLMRNTQTKTVFLKTLNNLPNNNIIQLFLDKVYDNNPISSISESETKKFLPEKEYYLLFDLIFNSNSDTNLVTSFSVDKNWVSIEDVISINDYVRLMIDGFSNNVDWTNEELLVDEHAKQAKLLSKNIQGKTSVPILLKISIDENASGTFTIKYESENDLNKSLSYSKEFEIGASFCTSNCPTFYFDNFLITKNEIIPIPETERLELFVGDDYNIKTIVTNLSDQDFGQISLINNIKQNYFETASFENDLNESKHVFNLNALVSSSEIISNKLVPKSKVGFFEINQILLDSQNNILPQIGNDNLVRLRTRNKEEIIIEFQPEIIEAGQIYPMALIKTKYKTGGKAKTNWTIKGLVNEEEIDLGDSFFGSTDENGLSYIRLDVRSLDFEDKLVIIAENDEAIPAKKIVSFTKIWEPVEINEPENCVTINTGSPNNIIGLNVDETKTITIQETCGKEKSIQLVTDLLLSEIGFDLSPNEVKTISLTATPKNGLLGVYPIRVFDKSLMKEAGIIDVIISDPNSCFNLEQAIFDLSNTGSISSKVTNNCFSGRKDNFYPKLDISTNSVSIDFKKPGNPQDYNLNIEVIGTAIEGIVYGFGWGSYWQQVSQKSKSCSKPPTKTHTAPETLDFLTEGVDIFVNYVEGWAMMEPGDRPVTEFDLNRPIPNQSWTPSSIETSSNNEKNKASIKFAAGDILEFYPSPIGSGEEEESGCSLSHDFVWVAAPRPPNFGGETWKGVTEKPWGPGTIKKEKDCNPCEIKSLSLEGGVLYTRGKDPPMSRFGGIGAVIGGVVGIAAAVFIPGVGLGIGAAIAAGGAIVGGGIGSLFGSSGSGKSAILEIQPEFYRSVAWGMERQNSWITDQIIMPEEGMIYNLGSYYDATPIPEWTNETAESLGEEEKGDDKTVIHFGVAPLGFLPREAVGRLEHYGGEEAFLESSALPYVEADASGLIHYYINQDTVPDGIDAWLNNGSLFVEYVGEPEVSSNVIDFNIMNNSLFGREYAVLRVADWVSGEEKEMVGFQVKLTGPTNHCTSMTGVEGVTGVAFTPRINFDWDWQNISVDACDLSNPNYFYCDATQFNISLFKKLYQIDELLKQNAFNLIPQRTVFYSYLIRDNYSKDFLNDFENYYSNTFIGADTFFVDKFNNLIKKDKIEFLVNRIPSETELPYGGLYRVEISIDGFDQGMNSLFDLSEPVKNVKVSLLPIQKAPNYNLFFETPFNGLVGKKSNSFERKDYGVSFEGESIRLNTEINTNSFVSSPITINTILKTSLNELDYGNVLEYVKRNDSYELTLYPSQPNPLIMLIDANNSSNTHNAKYSLIKTGQQISNIPQKTWALMSSTLGQQKCLDISGNDIQVFKENTAGTISWNSTKKGKTWIGTIFFTPKDSATLQIQPSEKITLYGFQMNQKNVMLDYYDQLGIEDYDTLKGILKMVQEEKMCISNANEENLQVWWNPKYLTELLKDVNPANSKDCVKDSVIQLFK